MAAQNEAKQDNRFHDLFVHRANRKITTHDPGKGVQMGKGILGYAIGTPVCFQA